MIRNSEYQLPGGPDAVLLVHGLTGTPTEMRPLAKGLHRAGYTVRAVQLAGHCGNEDDLIATGWRDWYASVDAAASELLRTHARLFVGGLSMGALLALRLAAERPQDIAGVAAYGATFRYDGWAIPPVARLSFLLPLLTVLGIGRRRRFVEQPPYGLKNERIRARIAAAMLGGDSAAAGLPGNPWPALAQMYQLSRTVRRQLPQVRSPCLVMHAAQDDVASLDNALLVCRRVSGPQTLSLLQNSYHLITLDGEREQVVQRSVEFFSRVGIAAGAATPASFTVAAVASA
ncbi:carboxylesterase [Solimonas aquatica]|uniref:Carboxylesterase n=1 Tax=Solimonas aquatica TaxID=489703 RepID=A0A1H9F1A9_9GAMM|nr:alpha/beta fold hydrolase [Solimonas aquatica]SEQ31243.1 carboxylesterase [Solimonas aquatica]